MEKINLGIKEIAEEVQEEEQVEFSDLVSWRR